MTTKGKTIMERLKITKSQKGHLDKVEELLAAGDDVEVLLGGADDGEDDLEADVLLAVVLAELERVGDVVDELGVVDEEVHGVLHALDADGQRDVVVAAEERQPQLPATIHQIEFDRLRQCTSIYTQQPRVYRAGQKSGP